MTGLERQGCRRGVPRLAGFGLLAAGLVLALGGCEETRRVLGYDKSTPDEFRIVSRAPLSLPPDYNLRPPQPGAVRPQDGTTRESARNSALTRIVKTFFEGSAAQAAAALVDSGTLSDEDLTRLSALIERAKKEGR